MNQTRQEQLRNAKRAQRARDREAGLVLYQAKLPARLANRLKAGLRNPEFVVIFSRFLETELIAVDEYPQLKLLCWNLKSPYFTRAEAFSIYERNWRLVDTESLTPRERDLVEGLTREIGGGVINA